MTGVPGEGVPVDLRADGVLWLINASVFHPRGFALAVDDDDGSFALLGDGSEPWAFTATGEGGVPVDGLFAAAEALLERARVHNGAALDAAGRGEEGP